MSKGRPVTNDTPKRKWQVVSENYDGEVLEYNFDLDINPKGIASMNVIGEYKGKFPEIDPKPSYAPTNIVLVFKTSELKKAPIKMKVWKNKNIDDVIVNPQAGVPEDAVILELGVGSSLEEKWRKEYKIEES